MVNQRVDPNLAKDVQKFGKGDWNECFHCGNCTAVCPLTEQGFLFPRKGYRLLQMGLKHSLSKSLEPWLCYYCGDCSKTCPRNANPGETMMILRRYLTSVYDWTGLSGRLYKSFKTHLAFMSALFFGVVASFLLFARIPILTDPTNVQLNSFAPVHIISLYDHITLVVLSFFLITNVFNMYKKTLLDDKEVKIPIWLYVRELWKLIFYGATQWRFSKCEHKGLYWFSHLFLMVCYVTMFSLIVVFLGWFQTDEIHPLSHPQRWLGYIITAGFLFSTIYFIVGRIKKKEEIFKFTHHSDWIFLILLLLVAITGILLHIFRVNGMARPTYVMYVLHLAVELPLVVTFVAFSKWSHLVYRPLAIYFANLKKAAMGA